MPDEPTVGELARLIQGMRADQAAQFRGLREEISKLVSVDYLALHEKLLSARIDMVVKDVGSEVADRQSDTSGIRSFQRWMVGVVVAVAAIVIPLVISLRAGVS